MYRATPPTSVSTRNARKQVMGLVAMSRITRKQQEEIKKKIREEQEEREEKKRRKKTGKEKAAEE